MNGPGPHWTLGVSTLPQSNPHGIPLASVDRSLMESRCYSTDGSEKTLVKRIAQRAEPGPLPSTDSAGGPPPLPTPSSLSISTDAHYRYTWTTSGHAGMLDGGSERTGAYSNGQYDALRRRYEAWTPLSTTTRGVDDWIKRYRKSAIRIVVATVLCPFARAAPTLEVDNPPRPPVQCEAFEFTWRGGTAPFVFSVLSDQSSSTTLEQFSGITTGFYRWTADIAAGTSIVLQIADATGASVGTGPLTVQASSDSGCVASATQPQPSNSASPTDTPVQHSSTTPTTSSTPLQPSNASSALPSSSGPDSTPPTHTSPVSSGDGPTSIPGAGGTSSTNSNASSLGQGESSGAVETPVGSLTVNSSSSTGGPNSLAGSTAAPGGPVTSIAGVPSASGIPGGDPSLPNPSLQPSSGHHMDVGAIIGAVCVAIAILALLAMIYLCRRRRLRRRPLRTADPERVGDAIRVASLRNAFAWRGSAKSSMSRKDVFEHKEEENVAEQERTEERMKSSQPDAPANRLSVDVEPPTPLPFLTALTQPSDLPIPLSPTSDDKQVQPLDTSIASRPQADSVQPSVSQDALQAAACGSSTSSKTSPDIQPISAPSRRRMVQDGALIARGPVHDTDGGVRLAGGPPGEEMDVLDDASYSAPSLLPPPYSRY